MNQRSLLTSKKELRRWTPQRNEGDVDLYAFQSLKHDSLSRTVTIPPTILIM
jgi:hypothetical protein